MTDMTLREARSLLEEWARLRAELDKRRDPLVCAVLRAGVQKVEVARITGLARTTIDRIAAGDEPDPAAAAALAGLRARLAGDVD